MVAALLAAASGCGQGAGQGGTAYPVKGQVLLANGKPLTGGRVIFLPKEPAGMTAVGDVGSDGTFALKTADGREGAPAGEYNIRVEPSASLLPKTVGRLDPKALPFAQIYMDEDGNTGLTATVKAEPTQLTPFRLEDPKPAATKRVTD
jgi:hypothetical protein